MNKKGFTLVELLAVIIILSLLALLASTSVTKIVKDSKSDLYETQIELIKSAAEAWGADNLYDLPEAGTCKYLTLQDLKQYGLVDLEIKDPRTNELFPNELLIKISGEENKFGLNNITYEINPDNLDACTPMFTCTLINDSDNSNSITLGDKYQCKVKDEMEEGFEQGYYFYVLGTNNDGTTNLIMERNMYYDSTNDVGLVATETNKGSVAWYAPSEDHSYGPVTAMTYLHNATKDWDNVPNMIMNYEDENIDYDTQQKGTNGYGSIKTTDNITKITSKNNVETGIIENLKTRLPRYNEVHGENKCLTYAENDNKFGSCPLWLSNYLSSSSYVTGEGLQNISGILGYWTLSSIADFSDFAWYVACNGFVYNHNVDNASYYGVRPVITLKL